MYSSSRGGAMSPDYLELDKFALLLARIVHRGSCVHRASTEGIGALEFSFSKVHSSNRHVLRVSVHDHLSWMPMHT